MLIEDLKIYTSNEEDAVLNKLEQTQQIETFPERERFIIENLIRKSLVIKIPYGNSYLVTANELN
jgi:hypothetical protein